MKKPRATGYGLQAGFTLIELMIVVIIMGLMTTLVLANNTKFGGKVLLENLAYDTALSIREAQVYGISVSRTSSGIFTAAYGVHFDLSQNAQFIIFADIIPVAGPNGMYDAGDSTVGKPYIIGRNYKINKLCTGPSASETCAVSPTGTLDIVFKRPDPDACIGTGTATIVSGTCNFLISRARIELISPQGDTMSVVVQSTGQISVQ